MRILVAALLLTLLALALPASPASAELAGCACASEQLLLEPTVCYETPRPTIADFAWIWPSHFIQAIDFGPIGICRHNDTYLLTDPLGTLACVEFIGCLCGNPSPGAELPCNGNDDDCDPGTPDAVTGPCQAPGAQGICAEGALACVAGAAVCQPGAPVVEVCDNGLDDDCDGDPDAADADCATSPLGTNLAMVADYSSEQPFVDAFKASRSWITQCDFGQQPDCDVWDTGESALLDLDEHGWVRSLPAAEDPPVYWWVGTLMFRDIGGHYPAGQYVVLYEGEGTLEYGFDAVKDQSASAPGRDVLLVTPSNAGIYLKVRATDPAGTGNHIRDIRVLHADFEATHETQPFSSVFLGKLAPYEIVRFMDWMQTNHSVQQHWADRPTPTDARHSTPDGVPLEVMADLANRMGADPWFTLPHQATDDYVQQFATLALAQLDPGRDVYVEYSNEIWNGSFSQGNWVQQQAELAWPGGAAAGFTKRVNWHGKRTAEICDIWKAAWGAQQERVLCVMGAQASNDWVGSQALDCPLWSEAPCSAHGISALAIGPYFGRYLGIPDHEAAVEGWTADPDGGLGRLFDELFDGGQLVGGPTAGAIQQATDFMLDNRSTASTRSLDLLTYEGGQHLVGVGGVGDNAVVTDLFIAANRDARMGEAYSEHLESWRGLGGGGFVHFLSMEIPTKFGSWGALEHLDQTGSPKYDALVEYSSAP